MHLKLSLTFGRLLHGCQTSSSNLIESFTVQNFSKASSCQRLQVYIAPLKSNLQQALGNQSITFNVKVTYRIMGSIPRGKGQQDFFSMVVRSLLNWLSDSVTILIVVTKIIIFRTQSC